MQSSKLCGEWVEKKYEARMHRDQFVMSAIASGMGSDYVYILFYIYTHTVFAKPILDHHFKRDAQPKDDSL